MLMIWIWMICKFNWDRVMNFRIIFLGCMVALAGVAYAAPSACDTEKNKTTSIVERCKKIGKGKKGYDQCVDEAKTQQSKAKQVCDDERAKAAKTALVSNVSSPEQLEKAIKEFEETSNVMNCRDKTDKKKNANCATVLQMWSQQLYTLEEINFNKEQGGYEELVQWCADRDNNVKKYPNCAKVSNIPKMDHSGSLPLFLDYVEFFPDGQGAPNMLFQASFILEINGNFDEALKLRHKLVEKYPNHTLAPSAWLRIGEYYCNNSKWSNAIKAYEKISSNTLTNKKEAGYAMFHLAESYYNQAEFETAARKFWEYIDGADKNKYIKDLRVEAMDFMATSFSDMDDGITVAAEFIKSKNVPYRDSLYFRIGIKAKDHDRLEQALQSFEFLLKISETYVDAPLADTAIVGIYMSQQKFARAQEQRYSLVKRYDRNSAWYKKNSGNKESVTNAERAIRSAMLDIPTYIHINADSLLKLGDTEGAKREYSKAVKAYDEYLVRYKSEPDWNEYKVHMNLSLVYSELKQYEKQAGEFNWIVDVDTARYGRRPQNFGAIIGKNDAAYNAVVAMDVAREAALKTKANNDTIKAYSLPETKAYFAQVDRYMAKFGKDSAAPDLAYNAALIHYEAKQYKISIDVLRKLITDFPNHKYTLLIYRRLAQALLMDDQLDASLKELEWLFVQYTDKKGLGVKDSNAVIVAKEIETSIAAVLYQKAEKAVKTGQSQVGADAYIALVKRFPKAEFSDKALFEAAVAYETANQNTSAAEAWMRIPKEYPKSGLAIQSYVRAARAYRKDEKRVESAKAYLSIVDNFPQDSTVMNAIFAAAQTYDSIPGKDSLVNKRLSAQTYEIAFKRYPKHERTPGALYNACLAYDNLKDVKEAIRCSRDLVREYPKSAYALDAAYSIPIAYENAKDWPNAVKEYEFFTKNYQADKEKLINAYTKIARGYMELKDTAKAAASYKNTIATYDKFGIQLANSDPAFAAEASFMLGEFEKLTMNPLIVKGNDKAKLDMVKKLMGILQNATKHYAKSAEYASEKWTFRAKNRIAELFVALSAKVREQEIDARDKKGKVDKEKLFVERLQVVQQLPSYYEQARPLFQVNIDLAREQGYYNSDVVIAQDGYIEMFYRDCQNFDEVGNAFAEAPLPDSVTMVKELEYDGYYIDDAVDEVRDFLETYREELMGKSQTAKQGALPRCANGIKAAAHYGIKNRWTDSLYALVKKIDPGSEILSVQIKEFDPSTLFRDDDYIKIKARLTQVEKSEELDLQEQVKIYREIASEGKNKNAALKKELASLKAKLKAKEAPPPDEAANPGSVSGAVTPPGRTAK
jgi:TolA-binding protein